MSNHNQILLIKSRIRASLATLFLLAMLVASSASAQEGATGKNAVSEMPKLLTTATTSPAPQSLVNALSTLPEADIVLYMSPHRILTEVAPRVMPEKDFTEMRDGLGELKKAAGIDPTTIDYVVILVRFKKPGADLSFSLPEFMIVTSGDFGAETLLKFAKDAAKEKLHDESYGSRTLSVMTIDELAREAEKTPLLKSLSEVAVVSLNGNTIAVGTTAYVKAAIDAVDGKGRISPDLLNSALRDPAALVSIAGSPWTAFAKTFALLGTENKPREARCVSRLGDFYIGITMDTTSFKLRGAMNADNPDTARIIKSLLSSLLEQATRLEKDKNAQAVLSSLVITPTDTEVLVQAEVSQQAVADFIRQQAHPQTQEVAKPPATKPTPKRRHRRTQKSGN